MTTPTSRSIATKVKLESSDHVLFEVGMSFMQSSQMVMNVIEVTGKDMTISLQTISSQILTEVVEYCTFHSHFGEITDGSPVDADTEKRNAE